MWQESLNFFILRLKILLFSIATFSKMNTKCFKFYPNHSTRVSQRYADAGKCWESAMLQLINLRIKTVFAKLFHVKETVTVANDHADERADGKYFYFTSNLKFRQKVCFDWRIVGGNAAVLGVFLPEFKTEWRRTLVVASLSEMIKFRRSTRNCFNKTVSAR